MGRQGVKGTFLSLKEVLDRVKVSRATLYKWMSEGIIKRPLKNGRGRLFWNRKQLRDLVRFVKERYTPHPME
jgi:predicted site-specific integrase-resolvase